MSVDLPSKTLKFSGAFLGRQVPRTVVWLLDIDTLILPLPLCLSWQQQLLKLCLPFTPWLGPLRAWPGSPGSSKGWLLQSQVPADVGELPSGPTVSFDSSGPWFSSLRSCAALWRGLPLFRVWRKVFSRPGDLGTWWKLKDAVTRPRQSLHLSPPGPPCRALIS